MLRKGVKILTYISWSDITNLQNSLDHVPYPLWSTILPFVSECSVIPALLSSLVKEKEPHGMFSRKLHTKPLAVPDMLQWLDFMVLRRE